MTDHEPPGPIAGVGADTADAPVPVASVDAEPSAELDRAGTAAATSSADRPRAAAAQPHAGRRRFRRPPWWLLLSTVAGAIAVAVLLQQRSPAPIDVRVADLPVAVTALEARAGGPQRYTELNATPDGVNLFVAQLGDQQEQAWFFDGTKLGEPSAPAAVAAPVFALQGVDLTLAPKIARAMADQFPGARITRFALVRQQDQVMWSVRALSSKGGTIEAFFTPEGKPLGGALK